MKHILLFTIKVSLIVLSVSTVRAQDTATTSQDTLVYKQNYGLRLGGDIYKLGRSFWDDDYKGFEINGDYRLTKRWYLAGELGTEEKITKTDFLDAKTTGSYFKAGADYNFYRNWLNMENMLYAGLRVGVASFKQELNNFKIYDVNNQFFNEQFTSNQSQEFSGLSAIWAEVQFGIKAELLNNLYAGVNVQMKFLVSEDEPSNFENLYIPGFNRTFDSNNFGFGFGYNLSYLIPIFKKDKKVAVETTEE